MEQVDVSVLLQEVSALRSFTNIKKNVQEIRGIEEATQDAAVNYAFPSIPVKCFAGWRNKCTYGGEYETTAVHVK